MKLLDAIWRVLSRRSPIAALDGQVHDLRQQLASIQDELEGYASRLLAVQEALLPREIPVMPGFQAAVSYQPRRIVGGDCYGVVPFAYPGESGDRNVAFAVGDVCGHDVSATVVMAMVLAILRCYQRVLPASPANVLGHVNARLCELGLPNGFLTAFIGFLSLDDRKLTYSTAGHPRPLVRNPDGTVRFLTAAAGLPLGVFEETTWQDAEDILAPGSMLCLYTDGVTETAAPDGGLYGLEALVELVRNRSGDPQAIVSGIVADLRRHQGSAPQGDDRTLLVVQV